MLELAVLAAALSYILWGVVHHFRNGDLYWKVVLEYAGLALLGLAVVFSLRFFF